MVCGMTHRLPAIALALAAAAVLAAGCGSSSSSGGSGSGKQLKVIATTTQLGDFARAVGGAHVDVTQILKPNTDPHDYEPRPEDVRETAGAKVVLESGDELDKWMADIVEQSGTDGTRVDVGSKLTIHRPGETSGPEKSKYDPHWWHDPRNAEAAVAVIRDAFIAADKGDAAAYRANADRYLAKLRTLDSGIQACFAKVPVGERKLVTDHDAFGYFAARYDISVVGAVIPSQTTQAQPNAGDVADLVKTIEREHVHAVFPESSINPKLAKAIARQTGASSSGTLYGDTLGPAGSSGATYLQMEQANADAMAKGFTDGKDGCSIPGL
jgi:zinc/manganese transport system substrate-binding protein